MKRLPPTLREDYRYLEFQVRSETETETGEVVDAIWESCLSYLGAKFVGESGFWIIGNRLSEEDQEGVIRVEKDHVSVIRAALTLVDHIGDKKAFIQTTGVSGSIEGLDSS